jgi:hypothetical protein
MPSSAWGRWVVGGSRDASDQDSRTASPAAVGGM